MPYILVYQTPKSDYDFFINCLPCSTEDNQHNPNKKAELILRTTHNLIDAITLKEENINNNFIEKNINLAPFTSDKPIFASEILIDEENNNFEDGFRITEDNKANVLAIFERMVEILRDPNLVFKNLKNLDATLGEQMIQRGLEMSDNSPQYYIAGSCNYILGPWKEGYQPLKKGSLLSKELLRREQEAGINLDGVALFAGSIDPNLANQFVKDGHYFSEDEQISKFLLHSKYSHRLFFEIIRQAAASGDLNLEVDGRKLTEKQLVQMMVSCELNSSDGEKTTAWDRIFDNIEDSLISASKNIEKTTCVDLINQKIKENSLNPDNYCFSSRSPNVLKSLITCFGKEELPNLCRYMTDSHYKQTAKMIDKLRNSTISSKRELSDIPDDVLYLRIIQSMFTDINRLPNNVLEYFPFTSSNKNKLAKTDPFDEFEYDSNIRRKPETRSNVSSIEQVKVKYNSFPDYISEIKSR
jgi:hypothetical protein